MSVSPDIYSPLPSCYCPVKVPPPISLAAILQLCLSMSPEPPALVQLKTLMVPSPCPAPLAAGADPQGFPTVEGFAVEHTSKPSATQNAEAPSNTVEGKGIVCFSGGTGRAAVGQLTWLTCLD